MLGFLRKYRYLFNANTTRMPADATLFDQQIISVFELNEDQVSVHVWTFGSVTLVSEAFFSVFIPLFLLCCYCNFFSAYYHYYCQSRSISKEKKKSSGNRVFHGLSKPDNCLATDSASLSFFK